MLKFKVKTDYIIAYDSPDHLQPFGVAQNNNHNQSFNDKLVSIFNRKISLLDLGCAGGHSVYKFNHHGHDACGLEGSDYRKRRSLPEWDIEQNLLTCDVSKPFIVSKIDSEDLHKFDCVTAWELIEHIKESDLNVFFSNIKNHMHSESLFIGSICVFDEDRRQKTHGIEWGEGMHHQTIYPREWWYKYFTSNGFILDNNLLSYFGRDVVRGPGVLCGEDCTINFVCKLSDV